MKQFEDHKRFLFEIFETKNPKWAREQAERKAEKIQVIRNNFIMEAMRNPDKFEDEDRMMSDVSKSKPDGQASAGASFS